MAAERGPSCATRSANPVVFLFFFKSTKDSLQNLKDTQKALLHLVIIIQGVWDKVVSLDIEMFRKQPKLQNNKHCFKIADFLQRPTGLSIAKQHRRQSHVRKEKNKKIKNKKTNVVLQINDPYRCFLVRTFKTKKCESFSVSVNRENFNTILQKSIKAMQLDLRHFVLRVPN